MRLSVSKQIWEGLQQRLAIARVLRIRPKIGIMESVPKGKVGFLLIY